MKRALHTFLMTVLVLVLVLVLEFMDAFVSVITGDREEQ